MAACSGEQSVSNNEFSSEESAAQAALADPRRGEIETLCGSCHKFVEPGVLSKSSWNTVLEAMGPYLGFFAFNGKQYLSDYGKPNCEGLYPEKPIISEEKWQGILDYFQKYAPEESPKQERSQEYTQDLNIFEFSEIPSNQPPIVSLSYIAPSGKFFSYDAMAASLIMGDEKLKPLAIGRFKNPLSYMQPWKNVYIATAIGSIFPSDKWEGELQYITVENGMLILKETYKTGLERPVQLKVGDLDGDKKEDIVICGFGNHRGAFYWLKNTGSGFERRNLLQMPGAISTEIVDIDKDGDLDIMVLFAQAAEKIVLFKNDGKGQFKQEDIVSYLPVQGSSSFSLADVNNDKILDIIYTCGDNADYSVAPKKFHGLYIYLGSSTGKYNQAYFYPMHGAYKAIARDYDGDGDQDIAVISFFADYGTQPNEGFLFFEQTGNLKFAIKTNPVTSKSRWLTMDVGDIDKDGDDDIILGNFSQGPSDAPEDVKQAWQKGPAVMILMNKTKK